MFRSHALKSAVLIGAMVIAAAVAIASQRYARLVRLTPILSVESIEPVVPFWRALGWEAFNPVEVDGELSFIGFRKDGQEIHYQTLAQIENRMPGARDLLTGSTALLYLTVDDIDAVISVLASDTEVVIPRTITPWGADELYVREPGGHLIGFAEFGNNR